MKHIACDDAAFESVADLRAASKVSNFCDALFSLLNGSAIQYCVLGDETPAFASGREILELAVHSERRREFARSFYGLPKDRFRPVQCISMNPGTDQFHFALLNGSRPLFVRVEVQYLGKCALLSAVEDELFARSRWQGKCWVAAPADKFSYLLAKVTQLGELTGPEEETFKLSVETLGRAAAEKVAGRLFGLEIQTEVVAACSSGSLRAILPQLRNVDVRNNLPRRIARSLLAVVGNGSQLLRNWFRPNGVLITILGPDGAGKTTLSTTIFDVFGPVFGSRKILLWRPEVLPRLSKEHPLPDDPPHSKPARGGLESVLRILAVFLDYWIGHFILVKPLLSRSGLIVYDRDIHDMLVDSRRYRYGGPKWLPRLLIKALPRTESLFLILDAPPEIILARKQEVPPAEVRRQLAGYRKLATDLRNSYLVHTDGDLEATTLVVARSVVDYLGRRYENRHNQQIVDSSSRATKPLTSWTETIRGMAAEPFSQSKSWMRKGFLAVADQGLISGSNFVLAILLARWLPAEQYGAYALSFAIFLLLSLIQQGLFLEPMSVFGPSVYRNSQRKYLGTLLAFQGALAAVSIAFAAAAAATRLSAGQITALGMLFSAPCILLYWFARRAFYLQLQPGRAVAGAILYCALLAIGICFLVRTGLLSAFTAFLATGTAALITSVRQLFQLRPILAGKKPSELWQVGNDHWRYGRWAILSFLFIWIPWNIYYPVVGHFSGLAEVAVLRALLNLALPMMQALSAFTLLFLPHASRVSQQESWAGAQRVALRITAFFALGSVVYWLPVCLFRTSLLQLLYGGHYSGIARLVPWIALSSFLSGLALGPCMAFRAMRSPSIVTFVYLISSGIAVLFGIPATHFFGIAGAVTCNLLSSVAAAVLGWTLLARQPRPGMGPRLVEQEAVL